MRLFILLAVVICGCATLYAQDDEEKVYPGNKPTDGLELKVEMQGSLSHGKTPLWLNANKYGLSSLKEANGYLRFGAERPLSVDNGRKWGYGYGVDVAVPFNYTSDFVIQQAYVEGRWWHGTLTVGSKECPMELKNNRLSSGSQTLGINARPVPQVRLALPEYWTIPALGRWFHIKGHIAYGKMTDEHWQHSFTHRTSRYGDDLLYHSKAGYLKIGNEEKFVPVSLELGLEMASVFGGTTYQPQSDGTMQAIHGKTGLKAYWNAFLPGGSDAVETTYQNVEGNQLGSWVMRLNYDSDWWKFGVYMDKYFEDHSSMLQLDYDGYGEGEEWQQKKEHRYLLYDFKDWMLGMEFNYKPNNWLNDIVFEYIYTKYQSGPIYHDHTQGISDHIGGNDNFYNHYIYPGWQHWGQVIGNPLYSSPVYNDDGQVYVRNNRFMAFHLGMSGRPTDFLSWRCLTTWQEGLGTYEHPYKDKHHNLSTMLEATYRLHGIKKISWMNGITITAGYGMDFGAILDGVNYGGQLTVAKRW